MAGADYIVVTVEGVEQLELEELTVKGASLSPLSTRKSECPPLVCGTCRGIVVCAWRTAN